MATKKFEKEKVQYTTFQNIAYAFRNIWRWDKSVAVVSFVEIPLHLSLSFLAILTPKLIIDRLSGDFSLWDAIYIIVLLLCVRLFFDLASMFFRSIRDVAEYKMTNHYDTEFNRRLLYIDYEFIEDPVMQNTMQKARAAVSSNTTSAMRLPVTFSNFFTQVLSFFLFGGILSLLNPLIVVFLLISAGVQLLLFRWLRRYAERIKEQNVKLGRRLSYLNGLSGDFENGKDIRLYNMASWLHEMTTGIIGEQSELHGGSRRRNFVSSIINLFLVFLRDGGAYLYLIYKILNGSLSAGDFTLYFGAIAQFAAIIGGFTGLWSNLQKASVEFNDYRAFCEIENKSNHSKGIPLPEGAVSIDINHLSYTYPGCDEPTLRDIDLHIRQGEKIAVVGLNGAGKSTLVKLICGMYTPSEGTIEVNGHDINAYNREEYYKLISAVFQYFRFLPVSIAENIAPDSEIYSEEKVLECLRLAGLSEKIEGFPEGINTKLVKNINPGAVEFSGGESQKLMLARAIYKDASILVLDEPTSALDPIAENNLYEQYNDLTKGKTSIFISHRLASTLFCDRIALMENGVIAELGTHEELMKKNGKYAELFLLQAKYYKEGTE